MTRERVEQIQREWDRAAVALYCATNPDDPRPRLLLLWGETIAALEAAWDGGCQYAGPGRGDCEHAIGLPGRRVSGQHDGPDLTVDAYGRPNGWCWSCWNTYQRDSALKEGLALTVEKEGMQIEIERLRAESAAKDKKVAALTLKVRELEEEVERLKLGYRGFP